MSTTEEVAAPGPLAADERRARHPGLILSVIVGAQLMLVLDGTIVNIALPRMGEYFHRSQTDMTWAVNTYVLAFGGLLLLGGRAGDILGRRRMLLTGLTLFTLGSLTGGLAPSFAVLLVGRVMQGVGAAIASPAALALLTTEFPAGPARTRALAVYSGVQGGGGAVGVLLGGVLTQYFSWRWVLFVNVPIGALLVPATYLYLRESEPQPGRFDWFGAVLSSGGMVSLVYGFISAARPGAGWRAPVTLSSFALAVVLLAGFVALETRLPYALMPLRIVRDRNRAGACIAMLSIGAGLAGMFFFVTFFIQLVLGFSALRNGIANLPVAFTVAVGAVAASKLMPRIGPRNGILLGALFVAAGLFWLATVNASSGYGNTLLPALLLFAFGTGQLLVPLATVVVAGVAPAEMGLASSLLNVGQQVGGAIGLSVLATVFATGLANNARHQAALLTSRVRSGNASPSVLGHFETLLRQGLSAPSVAKHDAIATHAAHSAIAHGTAVGFLTAGLLALVGGIVARTLITLRREDVSGVATPDAPTV